MRGKFGDPNHGYCLDATVKKKHYWEYYKEEELRRNHRKPTPSLHYKRVRDHCRSI